MDKLFLLAVEEDGLGCWIGSSWCSSPQGEASPGVTSYLSPSGRAPAMHQGWQDLAASEAVTSYHLRWGRRPRQRRKMACWRQSININRSQNFWLPVELSEPQCPGKLRTKEAANALPHTTKAHPGFTPCWVLRSSPPPRRSHVLVFLKPQLQGACTELGRLLWSTQALEAEKDAASASGSRAAGPPSSPPHPLRVLRAGPSLHSDSQGFIFFIFFFSSPGDSRRGREAEQATQFAALCPPPLCLSP